MNSLLLVLALSTPTKLPPIKSANDALLQLRTGKEEALANLAKACRGRLRHELKDHPQIAQQISKWSSAKEDAVAKAALDAHRCLTPGRFVAILKARLAGAKPAIVAYAAEVSARIADPAMVPPLLDALAKRKAGCMKADLPKSDREVCVWLTYAPGASLGGAPRALRERAAKAASKMFETPHAKVREVAVETVASAKLRAYGAQLGALIAKEKKGAFKEKNDAALLKRFQKRRRALKKGD